MRELLKVVDEERRAYEQHPWIRFLKDPSVPGEARLAYAPFAAHFIMTFADLNRMLMGEAPQQGADEGFDHIVSRHAQEDATHWAWYLADMETLGWNPAGTFNDTLRFLWRKEGRRARELGYHMIAELLGAPSVLRYGLIEAIEAMGNVWLNATIHASRAVSGGHKLVYFGDHHLDRETGHAIGSEDMIDARDDIELTPELRARGIRSVRLLFSKMSAFNDEILEHSLRLHEQGIAPSRFLVEASHRTPVGSNP